MVNTQEQKKDSVIGKVLSNPNSWLKGEAVIVPALIWAVVAQTFKFSPEIGAALGGLVGLGLLAIGLSRTIDKISK